ncbi:MAG: NfeD family protein [Micrococcales bacterium]|nr:NfeD family protein [Micrococcales bacterium]
MLSLDFTFLMLAVGSIGGLVSGLLGAPWWVQIIVAAVLCVALLFLVRPALQRRLHRGADPARSNVEALVGLPGVVLTVVDDHHGQAKLQNGDTWTARLPAGSTVALVEGARVQVTAIEGATAVVELVPLDRTERTATP